MAARERGEDDHVVLVVPGLPVERSATCHDAQRRLSGVAVDKVRGEVVFGKSADGRDSEAGNGFIGPQHVDDIPDMDGAQLVENGRARGGGVDVTLDDGGA